MSAQVQAPGNNAVRSTAVRRVVEFAAIGAGLALFVGALYYRLLFTNRVFASGDILHYFYPYREYAATALREGRIPLWNPYIFLGVPFLANPQAAVLYPLHWPLSWLIVTKQIAWSAALHTWLLGMGAYALMRHWRFTPWAGAVAAITLAGSGYYGGLLGHINQMNGTAWLPWAVLVVDVYGKDPESSLRWRPRFSRSGLLARIAAFGLLTALMFLAGHTQTLYIIMIGVGAWTGWPLLLSLWRNRSLEGLRQGWLSTAPRLLIYAGGSALALLMSGAQLLPTLELSGLGLRSGGLSYAEASSFSLKPLQLPWTLLPSYGLVDLSVVFDTLGYTEFVAYVGLAGLVLAGWGAWRGRGPARQFGLLMAAVGLFLAIGRWNPIYYVLYQVVPGFDLFRAPARWMMLYTLGIAVLAGIGTDLALGFLGKRRDRLLSVKWQQAMAFVLPFLIAVELIIAACSLPHTDPTAPQAVYDLRTAPAHLLTDPVRETLGPGAAGRFLSMSTISFDPGDMADYKRIFLGDPTTGRRAYLNQTAFDDLMVAFKAQEIIAPNLALLRRIPSVDGFDGGVLPLSRYLDLVSLLTPAQAIVPDGRLREQIDEVPDARLLGLLNAQYVITDKVRDLWFDDVYYDRQLGARLTPSDETEIVVEVPYPFEASHVDLIGYVDGDGAAESPDSNWTAARVFAVGEGRGSPPVGEWAVTAGPKAGAHFADGALGSPMAGVSGATVAYRDVEGGMQEYRARLPLAEPASPVQLLIEHGAGPDVVIQAVTLVDERTGMFLSLLPSDRGKFRRVHSGDVKVYEVEDALPRAYLIRDVIPVTDSDDALARLSDSSFDPARSAVVEGGPVLADTDSAPNWEAARSEIVAYDDETVQVHTSAPADAFLVLSDANYPGWQATIDGVNTEIFTANQLFRGVYVPVGEHRVEFHFAPDSWHRGLFLTGLGVIVALSMLAVALVAKVRSR